jgi:acetoacetyl-CoA synthetase
MSAHPDAPPVLWSPPPDARTSTRLGEFLTFCERRTGREFADYDDLWSWSIDDGLEDCWAAIWEFFRVESATPYAQVLDQRAMPGARWFGGASLNYAEHVLRSGTGRPADLAIVARSQSRDRIELTWGELVDQVARARAGLQVLGVRRGDRVAAYLPNIPETIVAFLAACSLGATWTSCAPEFGVQAVLDRFSQVEPTVLLGVTGYRYGRHDVSRGDELAAIRAGLPSLVATVVVPYGPFDGPGDRADGVVRWSELLDETGPLEFEHVPLITPCTSCTRRARPGCPNRSSTATVVSWSST